MTHAALLLTAVLFGGSILYSFGFAAFVFNALPAETAGVLIRRAFPYFYLFVFATAGLAAALSAPFDRTSAIALAAIAVTVVPARQVLMPAINAASDGGHTGRFRALHSLSVAITLAHIAAAGIALVRVAGAI